MGATASGRPFTVPTGTRVRTSSATSAPRLVAAHHVERRREFVLRGRRCGCRVDADELVVARARRDAVPRRSVELVRAPGRRRQGTRPSTHPPCRTRDARVQGKKHARSPAQLPDWLGALLVVLIVVLIAPLARRSASAFSTATRRASAATASKNAATSRCCSCSALSNSADERRPPDAATPRGRATRTHHRVPRSSRPSM